MNSRRAPQQQKPKVRTALFDEGIRTVFTKDVHPVQGENTLKQPVPEGSSAWVTSFMFSKGQYWYNLRIQDSKNPERKFDAFHIEEAALDFHPDDYRA
ncbi:hypothetical protein NMY22_g5108 [Coprinellus aureogranulatus]|nr:hypothetical protein NMY22_g5108 [Coprinellus aureogranulatus]